MEIWNFMKDILKLTDYKQILDIMELFQRFFLFILIQRSLLNNYIQYYYQISTFIGQIQS